MTISTFTQQGAMKLIEDITDFWRDKCQRAGCDLPNFTIERVYGGVMKDHPAFFIRSDMLNGYPRGYKPWNG